MQDHVEVELTPSAHEVRVSAAGEVIDGKTFAGVLLVYLNPDERSVRAALAKGDMARAIPQLCRYYAAQGFKKAVFSHNADKSNDKPKLTTIDLTRRRYGYNPNGSLCRSILNKQPAPAGFLMPENQEA